MINWKDHPLVAQFPGCFQAMDIPLARVPDVPFETCF